MKFQLNRNKVIKINVPDFLQTLALSGVLGFFGLDWLQSHDVVTSYLPASEANIYRITLGLVAYLQYLAYHSAIVHANPQMSAVTQVIISVIVTVLGTMVITSVYGVWRKHYQQNQSGYNTMTAREQAFAQEPGTWTRLDIFDLQGHKVASGYLDNFDKAVNLSGDVNLRPLLEKDPVHETEQFVELAGQYRDLYIDASNGLKYYITSVLVEGQKAD